MPMLPKAAAQLANMIECTKNMQMQHIKHFFTQKHVFYIIFRSNTAQNSQNMQEKHERTGRIRTTELPTAHQKAQFFSKTS